METLRQRVVVPPDREIRITLRFPDSVPEGDADLLVVIAPAEPRPSADGILAMAGSLSGSERLGGDPLLIQKALRDEWR